MDKLTIWNVGTEVRRALMSHEGLKQATRGAISPLIAKEGTKFPFIVYNKASGWYDYNKDTVTGVTCTVSVIVFSDTYEEMCRVADMVDDAMHEHFRKSSMSMQLIGSDEEFQEDVYYQPMTFQFKL